MVVHIFHLSTLEAKTGESVSLQLPWPLEQAPGQPVLYRKILSLKPNNCTSCKQTKVKELRKPMVTLDPTLCYQASPGRDRKSFNASWKMGFEDWKEGSVFVNCLLHKQQNLTSDPQNIHKKAEHGRAHL